MAVKNEQGESTHEDASSATRQRGAGHWAVKNALHGGSVHVRPWTRQRGVGHDRELKPPHGNSMHSVPVHEHCRLEPKH